jgi:hypothetical protein
MCSYRSPGFNAVAGKFWRKQGYTEFLERLRREL